MTVVLSLSLLGLLLSFSVLAGRALSGGPGRRRWRPFLGPSHHQRIHDPNYLRRMLEAEGIAPSEGEPHGS